MKLTVKDKEFLENLRALLDQGELSIAFLENSPKRFQLKQNYGSKIEQRFGMTRQGVRWRFQRLLGDIYPSAYESLLFIESSFGTELRPMAMAIARERAEIRKKALRGNRFPSQARRQNGQHED